METEQSAVASPKRQRYQKVNQTWPAELPPLSAQEAISAAKRLYRFGMEARFTGNVKLTTGRRRYTWVRRGTLYVNPTRGWHHLVHDLSHYVHNRRWRQPHQGAHDFRHEFLEGEMVHHVVSNGWLEGKLKRPAKEKQAKPITEMRYERILQRLSSWQRKAKRAETAIKKLKRQQRYYETLQSK